MMLRRFNFSLMGLVLALLLAAAPVRSLADSAGADAEKFITGLADKAISALTHPDATPETRTQKFRILLNDNFDVRTIARWVLGRYWKKASKNEKTEYLSLFEELLVVTYVDRFAKYSGEQLKVRKSTATGDKDTVVYSEIIRTDGQTPLHVDWRVRARSKGLKIIDVMVEGVSMGQTQRSEFASVIRQNGGKVEGLLVELRKRVSKDA